MLILNDAPSARQSIDLHKLPFAIIKEIPFVLLTSLDEITLKSNQSKYRYSKATRSHNMIKTGLGF